MSTTDAAPQPRWDFLATFGRPDSTLAPDTWGALLQGWFGLARQVADRLGDEVQTLVRLWDDRLQDFGREPTRHDWSTFRPLRPQGENDWSDWLAYLLESSDSGVFAHAWLGPVAGDGHAEHASPVVERELEVGDRRADLVIHWRSGDRHTHVEVKIDDPNLDKTFETARLVHDLWPASHQWTDFILLREGALDDWAPAEQRCSGQGPRVEALTWTDVAAVLRQALARDGESVTWRAWAYAFCGVVESRLLGHGPPDALRPALRQLQALRARIRVLSSIREVRTDARHA
ncbi:MAG: hypothetical protein HY906_15465 [Deltaproteobacteria bacterium]|nr:hypothetical protein [Deltaproteobacteria bacterium]